MRNPSSTIPCLTISSMGFTRMIIEFETSILADTQKSIYRIQGQLLPPKTKLIVKALGLDKDTSYEVLKQTLLKLCRPEPNLPRLSTFMSMEIKPEDDILVHAIEIQSAVERLLTHPITKELIEFISLDAYTYSSSPQLAKYLAAKKPKTIKEAIRLTHKFKDRAVNNKLKMDIKTIEKKIESMCPYVAKLFAQEDVKFRANIPKKKKILLERNSLD
nr:hypothetical protein HmN_000126700 [Hymenolepis microstoma]